MMEVKISRNEKNVYEKFDMDNWMGIPAYTSDDATSYFDVKKLIYRRSESSKYKEKPDIGEVLSRVIQNRQGRNP